MQKSQAQEAVLLDWAKSFATQDTIMPNPSVKDGKGNVYVAGFNLDTATGADIALVKYDKYGDTVWTSYYTGSGYHRDQAVKLTLDANETNVYLTGFSYISSANNYDLIVMRYDSSGNQKWVSTYNGAGSSYDAGADIVVKNNRVYVTGATFGGFANLVDYVTLQYDTAGSQLWATTYDYVGFNDVAYQIALDGDKIVVTGGSQTSSTNWDYATVSYDTTGTQVYLSRITGAGYGLDAAKALTVDKNGYIYFTGGSMSSGGNYDYKTIKMDTAGNVIWNRGYNYANLDDIANAICVDTMGNVYVTGQSISPTSSADWATIKYDSAGNQLWVKRFDGDAHYTDYAYNCVWSKYNNNLYVTGSTHNTPNSDYLTICYNSSGAELWKETYDGSGHGDDVASDISVDSTHVYVTGQSWTGSKFVYVTLSYSMHDFVVPPDTEAVTSNSIFYPNRGQIMDTRDSVSTAVKYYTLHTYPQNYFLEDTISYVFSSKPDSATHADTLQRIDLTFGRGNNGIVPYGSDKLDKGYLNYFLPQCPTGITGVYGYERILYHKVANDIDVLFSGNSDGLKYYIIIKPGGDTADIELKFHGADSVNITSGGELDLVSHWGIFRHAVPTAYQIDNYGNRVAVGFTPTYYSSGTNNIKFHLGSYDSSKPLVVQMQRHPQVQGMPTPGNVEWSTYFGGAGDENGRGVATDADGNSYWTGTTNSSVFPRLNAMQYNNHLNWDVYISKFRSAKQPYPSPTIGDQLRWSTFYGGSAFDEGIGIASFGAGESGFLYVVGNTQSSDLPTHNNTLVGAQYFQNYLGGGADAFIIQLDNATGGFAPSFPIWATYFGGAGTETCFTIAYDRNNPNIIFMGGMTSTASYDSHTCVRPSDSPIGFPQCNSTSAFDNTTHSYGGGGSDGFIAQFDKDGVLLWSTYFGGNDEDEILSLAVDNHHDLVVTGGTKSSSGFPLVALNTSLPYAYNQSSNNGGYDAFVGRFIWTAGSPPQYVQDWGTYYGGSGDDFGRAIVANSNDDIYIGGSTTSSGSGCYPVCNCVLPTGGNFPQCNNGNNSANYFKQDSWGNPLYGGSGDAFLAEFTTNGEFYWGTYYGGNNYDKILSLYCGKNDALYFTGSTGSINGSTTDIYYNQYPSLYYDQTDNSSVSDDVLLGYFDNNNTRQYSTYFGNNNDATVDDIAHSICVYQNPDLTNYPDEKFWYITGTTTTVGNSFFNWPIPPFSNPISCCTNPDVWNTFQGGSNDAFMTRFREPVILTTYSKSNLVKVDSVDVLISPNPTSSDISLSIFLPEVSDLTISISSLNGAKLFEKHYCNSNNIFKSILDLSNYSNGMYFVKIQTNKKIINRKIFKQR